MFRFLRARAVILTFPIISVILYFLPFRGHWGSATPQQFLTDRWPLPDQRVLGRDVDIFSRSAWPLGRLGRCVPKAWRACGWCWMEL